MLSIIKQNHKAVLQLRKTNNFGTDVFYPACETSHLFAELLNQRTLTRENIALIVRLGYKLVATVADNETFE